MGWTVDLLAGVASALRSLLHPLATRLGRTPSADTGATVVGETRVDDRTIDLAISSPGIDTPTRTVRLLLPPGWSRTSLRTWPTLWLLHGGLGDHLDWTANTDVAQLTEGRDVIVVMPDACGCGSYTDWYNDGAGGVPRWETFVTTEVRQILERGYRAGPRRAAAGNSAGGMAAVKFAARHPGLYRAAASFSGGLSLLYEAPEGQPQIDGPDLVKLGAAFCGIDWAAIWGDPEVPAGRAVWEANDPYHLAPELGGVALYVAAGDGTRGPLDPLGDPGLVDPVEALARPQVEAFAGRMAELGLPVTTHLYAGTHTWPYWERELHAAFEPLMAALGVPAARPAQGVDKTARTRAAWSSAVPSSGVRRRSGATGGS
ncbi:MAG TPA: alpha/beta hydrolase family protein [Acidimicrobiales bacterium]